MLFLTDCPDENDMTNFQVTVIDFSTRETILTLHPDNANETLSLQGTKHYLEFQVLIPIGKPYVVCSISIDDIHHTQTGTGDKVTLCSLQYVYYNEESLVVELSLSYIANMHGKKRIYVSRLNGKFVYY